MMKLQRKFGQLFRGLWRNPVFMRLWVSSTITSFGAQITNLAHFQQLHGGECPQALAELQQVAERRGNLFAELMSAVKVASLGQISGALYEVGGIYRRNM